MVRVIVTALNGTVREYNAFVDEETTFSVPENNPMNFTTTIGFQFYDNDLKRWVLIHPKNVKSIQWE